MEVDIYYDGLFKNRYEIGLDIRLRGMTDYDVPNGPFLHEIPSPPPRQLFEPAVRLLAEDAHLMPTVPVQGALAETIRASSAMSLQFKTGIRAAERYMEVSVRYKRLARLTISRNAFRISLLNCSFKYVRCQCSENVYQICTG